METLAERLRALREARDLKLREAARLAGVSASRLAEIERGKTYHRGRVTRPSEDLVRRLARAYKVSEAALLIEAGYGPEAEPELTKQEYVMLSLFRALSPERQDIATGVLRLLSEPISEGGSPGS